MEREQYAIMARREDRHWWYAGMRRSALALLAPAVQELRRQQPERPLRLLDAGCGTGGTTVCLARFGAVVGVDVAWEALRPAAARGLAGQLARASVERLPFTDGAFDAATSFEVIYHLGVGDDRRALAELRRVLRPGGWLLLRLPAHDWLRGAHDRLVHTRHRYGRAEVRARLEAASFRVERLSWANSALFLPAAAKRLLEPRMALHARGSSGRLPPGAGDPAAMALAGRGSGPGARAGPARHAEPDLWQPPEPLNGLLAGLVGLEALALPRGVPLPFGLSVIALARAV